jgi:hypothetical protein
MKPSEMVCGGVAGRAQQIARSKYTPGHVKNKVTPMKVTHPRWTFIGVREKGKVRCDSSPLLFLSVMLTCESTRL